MSPRNESSTELVYPADAPKYLEGIPLYDDFEALAERTIERQLAATSPEQLLSDPEAGGLRDLSGKLIKITTVLGIAPSSIGVGGYYIVFEAMTAEGASLTLTTGSQYAASRIATLAHKGWLPRVVRVTELESKTNPGQSSLWITDPGPSAVAAFESGEQPF